MISMILQLDPNDPRDVAQARRILDRLTGVRITDPAPAQEVPAQRLPKSQQPAAQADTAVIDLWNRTGLRLRELLKASAEQEGEFSIRDLAEALGQPATSVRSRFANLGRSIKAMQKAVPGAPGHVYEVVGDEPRDGIWYFTMQKDMREVILRTDVAMPHADGSLPT